MNIIVFGATGNTGKEIVSQAIAQGHSVTAFARDPAALSSISHVRIIQGDVFDSAAVSNAIQGHRAVLSALGARNRSSLVLTHAIPNIVNGMRQHYISRLIVLGASGLDRDHGKYQNALTNMVIWLLKKTVLRYPFTDQRAQERIMVESKLDYTIIRAPRLTDGPFTGKYRVLPDALPPGALRISRADVAHFMLLQLTDPRFHRQGPYIGS